MENSDSVFVVIPAYNEAEGIAVVIHSIRQVLVNPTIIVVDDGSEDTTASQAANADARVVSLPFNCGYGVALQTGLIKALRLGAQVVITMDADGQHAPASLDALIRPVLEGNADLVLGSRYLPGSTSYRVPPLRRFVSRCMALLLSAITRQHFTDTTTGFQCMNYNVLRQFAAFLDFPDTTPDADLILYAVLSGFRVREVPVTMHQDQGNTSMHGPFKSIFYVPKMVIAMLSTILLFVRTNRG